MGQHKNRIVGRVKASQKPTYFSAKTMPIPKSQQLRPRTTPCSKAHTNLAHERAYVYHHVEVQVDARHGDGRVSEDANPLFVPGDLGLDIHDLFGDQRRNIRLEAPRAAAHYHQANSENSHGGVGLGDDGREGGDDEEQVAEQGDENRPLDGPEATEVLIGDVGTDQRAGVRPESIDCCGSVVVAEEQGTCVVLTGRQTGRSLLATVQCAGLAVKPSASVGSWRQRLLDVVDICGSSA